jgi:hypothetical protein
MNTRRKTAQLENGVRAFTVLEYIKDYCYQKKLQGDGKLFKKIQNT